MPDMNGTRPPEQMRQPVPILLYHAITADPADWIAEFSVTPAVFGAHLDAVVASGRQPLTVSQYTDGLNGKIPLPPRPVLITVDDGFADFADNALPALTERKLPAPCTSPRARARAGQGRRCCRTPSCCATPTCPA